MSTRFTRENAGSKQNELHRMILSKQLNDEANRTCADCTERMPRWSSWSIGVFICLKCSGIHRSLGVHVSKVKSVNLDTWTREQINHIISRGNQWANQYYLSQHEKGPSHRISNEAPSMQLSQFIRNKYEFKKFMRHGKAPPLTDRSNIIAQCEVLVYGRSKKDRSSKKSNAAKQVVKVAAPTSSAAIERPKASPVPPNGISGAPVIHSQTAPVSQKASNDLLGFDFGDFSSFGNAPAAAPVASVAAPVVENKPAPVAEQPLFEVDFSSLNFNTPATTTPPTIQDPFGVGNTPSQPSQNTLPPASNPTASTVQQPTAPNNSIASIMSLYKTSSPTPQQQMPTQTNIPGFSSQIPVTQNSGFPTTTQASLFPSIAQDIFAPQNAAPAANSGAGVFMAAPSPIGGMNGGLWGASETQQSAPKSTNPFDGFGQLTATTSTAATTTVNTNNPFGAFSQVSQSNTQAPPQRNALDDLFKM